MRSPECFAGRERGPPGGITSSVSPARDTDFGRWQHWIQRLACGLQKADTVQAIMPDGFGRSCRRRSDFSNTSASHAQVTLVAAEA